MSVRIPEAKVDQIKARLRRIEGQLRGIEGMLDGGRECGEVITQFAAATRALEQAGYQFFAATLAQCASDPDIAANAGYSAEKLEKMFLQLA